MRTLSFILVLLWARLLTVSVLVSELDVPEGTVKGEIGTRVDLYLSRLRDLGLSGAAVVAKDGNVVLAKGYGLADRSRNLPITVDTVFSIGSVTKQFTGAAILKLEMQGKLSVQDKITKYFDGVPGDKAGITLHHLLTHSSGLKPYLGDSDFEVVARDEIVRRALDSELLWPPGGGYRYSNVGYSLLAAIVELVSDQSYDHYLRENLFGPAGMSKTGYLLPNWNKDELAHAYSGNEDEGTMLDRNLAADGPYWNLRGNGGLQSTVSDLYRWHVALEGEDVLSKEAKEKYFAPHVREGDDAPSHYGYGWAVFETKRGTRKIAHNGGDLEVFNTDFHRYVDEAVVLIIATSSSAYKAEFVSDPLAAIIFGEDYLLPPQITKTAPDTLSLFEGTYLLPSGGRLEVRPFDGRLVFTPFGRDALRLLVSRPGVRHVEENALARYDELVTEVVASSSQADYQALHDALGGQIPIEHLTRLASRTWDEWRHRHGGFKRFEVLGSIASQFGDAVSFVRLDFENGSVMMSYIWEGDTIQGMRPLAALPGCTFFPENEAQFAAFELAPSWLARFDVDKTDRGEVAAIVFETPEGRLRADKRH